MDLVEISADFSDYFSDLSMSVCLCQFEIVNWHPSDIWINWHWTASLELSWNICRFPRIFFWFVHVSLSMSVQNRQLTSIWHFVNWHRTASLELRWNICRFPRIFFWFVHVSLSMSVQDLQLTFIWHFTNWHWTASLTTAVQTNQVTSFCWHWNMKLERVSLVGFEPSTSAIECFC